MRMADQEEQRQGIEAELARPGPAKEPGEARPAAPDAPGRPRAYEAGYPWNLRRVPPTATLDGKTIAHPARESAIFVVHGIGAQEATETAAELRSGFEDALEVIERWQREHPEGGALPVGCVPPPFCFDGAWADYERIDETFAEDWRRFCERERRFFSNLWKRRASTLKTYFWFLGQQARLLDRRLLKANFAWWLLYLFMQPISFLALTFALLRRPKIVSGFLADVRLYLDPRGIYEKAVVQRIDYRVGRQFLKLIGLDWEFRTLPPFERIDASGERVRFDRVVWVAHSLGSVISYNVLSDLFHLAAHLERHGDAEQKAGVARFRKALRRFVTLGSPLDKVAFLFGKKVLRPWPRVERRQLVEGGENIEAEGPSEWWVNFFNILDPVSGALSDPLIVGDKPPLNLPSSLVAMGLIPGVAHTAYWRDEDATLRYILGRTYGRGFLRDRRFEAPPGFVLELLPVLGYLVWAVLLLASLWALQAFGPELVKAALGWLKDYLLG